MYILVHGTQKLSYDNIYDLTVSDYNVYDSITKTNHVKSNNHSDILFY